ncbi:MAG: NAD(P)-dependent alcohol dehydrogenase [Novosphingobium sp.]|nr:NAD(P)-dependent alcohol dehydrogenase [Novosphingobium sp.]
MTQEMRIIRLPENPDLDTLTVTHERIPQPGPGEALIRVRATSLNYHDYLVVAGFITQKAGRVPMSDGAGEVIALGDGATGLKVGDRVMGAFFPLWLDGPPTLENNAVIAGDGADGFAAEYVTVPASSLVRMPDGWSFEEAATLPCAGLTAWRALKHEGELASGDTVLLPGSGGLAVFALQFAKALGITTICTSSSDAKLERLTQLGAEYAINYRNDHHWGETAKQWTGGTGVDLVLEIGASSTFAQSVMACRTGGRIIVVGSTSHDAPVLPLTSVVMSHIRVQGMAVGSVSQLRELVSLVEMHSLRPIIDRTFPIEELGEAFRYQLTGQHLGKIAVTI